MAESETPSSIFIVSPTWEHYFGQVVLWRKPNEVLAPQGPETVIEGGYAAQAVLQRLRCTGYAAGAMLQNLCCKDCAAGTMLHAQCCRGYHADYAAAAMPHLVCCTCSAAGAMLQGLCCKGYAAGAMLR